MDDQSELDRLKDLEYKAYSTYHETVGFHFANWLNKTDYAEYRELMKKHFDVEI